MGFSPGAKLGRYEILSRLGAGGMGEVWKARDTRLDRIVAIKTSAAKFSDRFEREAKSIAALNHPHICQLYDVGPDYLVMEYIEGTLLAGPLSADQALRCASQISSALEAAHAKQITHRDLKPANILVTASGVKLLDFGLAKTGTADESPDSTETIDITEAGMVVGTAAYMSPEQARGETVDARSDIFSFGVVLYELLSGRRAFARRGSMETMAAILRDEPTPLDVPANVLAIVTRCLRKLPEDRFQTMSEVRLAIEQAASGSAEKKTSEKFPSIAVLPFANLSADKENEYFSDGLAEEILNLLAKIPGLKVIARTSSFAFRNKDQDITKIAETLRVQNILEGSVRKMGNRIRVTAQLIQASDGSHLWSERYDRDMTDVFALQDEIGQAISEALQVRLAPRTRVLDVEAWQHWLKGVHYRARNTPENAAKAKEHFEQALAIDPNYAQAWSGLALSYYVLGAMGALPISEMQPQARLAAEKALVLDPSDSESHTVLALMAGIFDYDWDRAEKHHVKSVTVEHVSPRARFCYAAYYLAPQGRASEAIEQSRLALQADPLSMLFQSGLVWSLYAARQYGEAIDCARRALEIDPNFHLIWLNMGFAQLDAGLPEDAFTSFRRVVELTPWISFGPGCLAAAYHRAGDEASAGQLARQFVPPSGLNFGSAVYHAVAGQPDAMFEGLEVAYQRRDLFLPSIRYAAFFDSWRADPRFQSLVRRINLA